ncbi:ACH96150.1 p47-like protein [Kallithea virus]|uniref:ACH96150.1 p47-like protein n=1 Tax=Kallithea virus TaxID=1654582 RepID=A0A0F7KIT7_9VIRU|nr:ACH96150.1 p47-like protein [Kallithea virus]AKH40345.1 putative p47 [Kallithea virus]AQN78572.1 ACH96150.1 p47-like protein [Kallithea virus]
MESTNLSNTGQLLDEDIKCLELHILQVMSDDTIRLAARAIAQFLLLNKSIPLYKAIELIKKPDARKIIWKLIKCQSDFMGPTPRSVGIDLVSEESASKIQQSLDVKHIKNHQEHKFQIDRIRPITKIDLAYTHPTMTWVRFFTNYPSMPTKLMDYNILSVCDRVYEAYGSKNIGNMHNFLHTLETIYDADLIFCSELPAFLYNPLLFLSNYTKFMWCYALNRNIFDPHSYQDIRMMTIFMTYGLMFLKTNNLSNMPKSTHGPLISCSGERPKVALGKFNTGQIFINEGSRAMQSMNKSSDFGTSSNFIEGIAHVKLTTNWLSNIV